VVLHKAIDLVLGEIEDGAEVFFHRGYGGGLVGHGFVPRWKDAVSSLGGHRTAAMRGGQLRAICKVRRAKGRRRA